MDDIGNIIYVLAVVGWFIWNMYSKSKKAKQPERSRSDVPGREEQPSSSNTFEELLMEQFGLEKEEEPEPEQPETVSEPVRKLEPEPVFANARSDRRKRSIQTIELEEENLMDELMPDGFDLRQAVVMQAILDRPYR